MNSGQLQLKELGKSSLTTCLLEEVKVIDSFLTSFRTGADKAEEGYQQDR